MTAREGDAKMKNASFIFFRVFFRVAPCRLRQAMRFVSGVAYPRQAGRRRGWNISSKAPWDPGRHRTVVGLTISLVKAMLTRSIALTRSGQPHGEAGLGIIVLYGHDVVEVLLHPAPQKGTARLQQLRGETEMTELLASDRP